MEQFIAPKKNNTIVKKYPTFRDTFVNGSWKWIEGKRRDDNASGSFWRIHNKLYDLNEFIDQHPGGKFWIETTKGTDITEAFESHHLTSKPSELLDKFYISDISEKRNYFLTFDENGFYRTLKSRIAEKLKTIDKKKLENESKRIHDFVLFAFIVMTAIVNRVQDDKIYWFSVAIAAQLLAWLVVISHNFLHKADNWRMYTGNLALMTTRDIRIQHILSHHMYPNSYADLEITCYEPYFKWLPTHKKGWYYRIMTIILTPSIHFIYFHNTMRLRFQGFFWGNDRTIFWDELVMYLVPCIMILFGGKAIALDYLYDVFFRWVHIMIFTNFLYVIIFINRGHHAPHLIHQGDEIQSYDFGEYQISAASNRGGVNLNTFTILSYYGENVLHQLFPTIDHAILPHLREIFIKTCKEFDLKVNESSFFKTIIDQWKQLYRSDVIVLSENNNNNNNE